jgi:hypothetical protein
LFIYYYVYNINITKEFYIVLLENFPFMIVQSAKIMLVHLKLEIFLVHYKIVYLFQYCDSTNWLFSFAPCKVIALKLLCFIFVPILCLFSWLLYNKYLYLFNFQLSHKVVSFPLLLLSLYERERATTFTISILKEYKIK